MISLKSCVKIVIVTSMLACTIILFYIFLVSSFSDWEITLSTNVFGEGLLELAMFFVVAVAGIAFLLCYIKKLCKNRHPLEQNNSENH